MQKNYMTYGMAARLSLGISAALFLFFIFNFYFRQLMTSPESADIRPTGELLLMILFGWGTIFSLLFILFAINFNILRSGLSQKQKILAIVVCSLLFTVLYSAGLSHLQMSMHPPRPNPNMPPPVRWVGIIRDLFLAVIVAFISQILYLTQKRQQVELRNEALEAENVRTRYEALKSQINPHFLFNTLSTLDSMVEIDPPRAREYIQRLSSVFRYTLKSKDVVPLCEELEFVRDYSDLMQIRHGDNLRIDFDTDKYYDNHLIVPTAVQGLVENAIKHNAFSDSEPLTITIETDNEGMLTVRNNFQPREYPEQGEGVGLGSLAERYRLKWQKEISIENTGETFKVTLPLVPPAKQNT